MKKATTSRRGELTVKIGRATEPIEEVTLSKGATIEDALEKAGIDVSESESLWVDGEKAEFDSEVEDNDIIQITGKKEGGR